MKFLIISLLALLLPFIGMAQQKAISESITFEWNAVQKIKYTDTDYDAFLSFNDALYDFNFGKLPVLHKKYALPTSHFTVTVKIVEPEYGELTLEEETVISDLQLIKSEPVIESKISTENKKTNAHVFILPFRKNASSGKYEKLVACEIEVFLDIHTENAIHAKSKAYAANSVLAQGNIYKICVSTTGIHKITYDNLVAMGVNVGSINPKHIKIYGNGNGMLPESNDGFRYDDLFENAIYVEGEQDNAFNQGDYVLFYGLSPHTWQYNPSEKRFNHNIHLYSDANCYFLTADHGPGKRIEAQASSSDVPTHIVNTFDDYVYHEKDSLNLIHTGREWFGETFDIQTEHSFDFTFPNIVSGSKVRLKTAVAARSFSNSTFNLTAGGNNYVVSVSAVPTSYTSDYARTSVDTFMFNATSANINVKFKYNKPTNNSAAWLNYIQFNVTRQLNFTGTQLPFRNVDCIGSGNISEFVISNATSALRVWDVTHPFLPFFQEYTLNGSQFKFTTPTDTLKQFIAFNGQAFLVPDFIGKIHNQNLHALGQYDFLIVSHPAFAGEAQRLAVIHYNAQNISCAVVTTEQIYNEFSSGVRDITAIRDYAKMFYDRASNASEMPKYLLLFGDGSYDNKNRTENNTAFIPTYQSLNSLLPTASYVTDDFFGLFDPGEGQNCDGSIDIGIGRFPVKTLEEAKNAVDKTIIYLTKHNILTQNAGNECSPFSGGISNYGDWRNVICFIADDEDGNTHVSQAEFLAGMVDTTDKSYNIDKIYFDAYLQQTNAGGQRYPEVNDAINSRVEKGALIVNYTGHGGEEGWAHERVLTVAMINNFKNKYNLPVFVTATCEFSRFDDPKRTSAGEYVFLNPNGGGIALFSTTRLAFASTNFSLNKAFYNHALQKVNNEYPTLGDLMKMSKNSIGNITSIRNFVLLGDPALKMVYPEYNVITTSVPDTMKAMSKVTISGHIADDFGNVLTDFNGIIYPTVFDKPSYVNTLANDPQSSVFTFKLQKNVLFKGKASVVNGYFSFDFIVPLDIAYTYGNGKISYYADDGQRDAKGYFNNFYIGGFDENFIPDNQGPEIRLYLNDTTFVFGGITDENPVLLALLSDENGINTTGNGIGHDITAILDDNTTRIIILNDYYESDLNSYQTGRVTYPLYNLDLGLHNIKVKVWDVHNNSSEAYLEFYVTDSEELAIKHLLNYPNPFKETTSFIFEHNQICSELNIEIEIYSLTGHMVKKISRDITSSGFKSDPIEWDGSSDGGQRLAAGVYVYKFFIKNCNGLQTEKSEKLILLK